ncbi:hypothetical protein INS49_012528 [Diaporthe citri]|uniref:uncharacterized protein n=1 Tax=Diaporthe citri TaxID=83186 RepID=UPI001C80AB2E|nr:uncharacterized protein INS49_012528 [Diaporthe citri]KAG6359008.1 hypothetical protein INS49_012528 [Diaporthe citri]
MADPHPERLDLDTLAVADSQPETLQCCCGNTDCVYLKHNCSVLDSVEKDVHTAAKLGQALLARHEAYMESAERDRFEMQSRIEQLETEKRTLEAENARTIQENRALLDQLESFNNSVIDSETQIRSLEATLQSSEQAIRKLQGAEARATAMEDQIADLEAEQESLRNTLVTTEGEARSAMQRWRRAEKGISDLQEKLEKIEREACEERERHAEVLARMEKQRSMEKDLNTAAGRLKGAAAAKTIGDGSGGTVVSHFVRDLLQDNANLQVGMAELRELLLNSNDEIQHLREQLIFHQPVEDRENSAASTLRAELDSDEREPQSPTSPKSPESHQRSRPAASVSQELHIHHHYHVAKPVEPKKPKKKRQNLVPSSGDAAPNVPFTPYYDDCYNTNTRPRLHRAASSESIMSLTGGLDIHTLKARPSQLSFRPLGAAMADTGLSAVTARPTIARGRSGSMTLRDKLSNPNFRSGDRSASASLALSSLANTPEVPQRSASSLGFGKLVGWRPWASANNKGLDSATNTPTSDRSRSASPNPASVSSPATSVIDVPQGSSKDSSKKPAPKELAFSPRTFGINQPGAIPGFQEYLAYHQRRGPQAKVVPDVVDHEALREILEEEGL